MFDLQFAVVRERLRKAKAQMLKNRVVQTAQSPTAVGFVLIGRTLTFGEIRS